MLPCTLSLFLFAAGLVLKIYFSLYRVKHKKLPPGPYPLPLIGNVLSMSAGPHTKFADWAKEYGDIFQVYIGTYRMYVLSDVKLVRKAFGDLNFSGRINKETFTLFTGGPHGVANSQGQEWVEQRRFTLRHLRNLGFGKSAMESLILEEVEEFVENLKSSHGQPLVLNRKFEVAVLNSLWRIVAGKRYRQDDPRLWNMFQQYQKAGKLLESSPAILVPAVAKMFPNWSGWKQLMKICQNQKDVFLETIHEHEEVMKERKAEGQGQPTDLIYAYLEQIQSTEDPNSSFYSEAGIKSLLGVIADLFNAGSDTTSLTLSWAVLYLSKYQNVQRKFQEEIDRVIGKHRRPCLADRFNTPYTEAILLEVFRKSSIVPIGLFHTTLSASKLKGYDVPKDTWVCANLHFIHHNPAIWHKPHEFMPERFLSEDGRGRISISPRRHEALIPFSIGKRACPAETLVKDQVFLFLTSIFQRFHIRLHHSSQNVDINAPELSFLLAPKTFAVITQDRLNS